MYLIKELETRWISKGWVILGRLSIAVGEKKIRDINTTDLLVKKERGPLKGECHMTIAKERKGIKKEKWEKKRKA